MKSRLHSILCALCAIAISAAAHAASTEVFSYSFDGDASTNLNGQSINGTSWVANTNFKADGSVIGLGSAWLAHTFALGNIYTLSVFVDASAASTNVFGAISFTKDNFTSKYVGRINDDTTNHASWALRKDGGQANDGGTTLFKGPGINSASNQREYTQSSGTLKLVLNTTKTTWTYDAWLDSTLVTSGSYNSTVLGTLTGVGLFASGTGVVFDDFSFSYVSAVPEPSTYALLLALVAILLVPLRLRRCR
ncbi:PEP-CTERM sorting domain-containing protein [Opitutaceae bacterium TAV4]|nr:PEP-CTERM sorting domain-containing protein [Opitutaceae bacterium TAV4]RRK02670.1 PEP-CTERM sorting domain-containing protein [Opitutaceae bacterium TAV3]